MLLPLTFVLILPGGFPHDPRGDPILVRLRQRRKNSLQSLSIEQYATGGTAVPPCSRHLRMRMHRPPHPTVGIKPALPSVLAKHDPPVYSCTSSLLSPFSRFVLCSSLCLADYLHHSLHLFTHTPIVNRIFPSLTCRATGHCLEPPEASVIYLPQQAWTVIEDR